MAFRLDKLYTLDPKQMQVMALQCVNAWNGRNDAQIIGAMSFLFFAICKRYRVDIRAVLEVMERVVRDAKEKRPVEMRALATYLREELKDV